MTGPAAACQVLSALNVVVSLQIQPELVRGIEKTRQPQRRVSTNTSPFAHDLVAAGGRDVERHSRAHHPLESSSSFHAYPVNTQGHHR